MKIESFSTVTATRIVQILQYAEKWRIIILKDVAAYKSFAAEHKLYTIRAHAPYTMNLCAEKENVREFSLNVLQDDLERLEHIPGHV